MRTFDLNKILFNSTVTNFLVEYFANYSLDRIIEGISEVDSQHEHDVSLQLLDTLQKAHLMACNKLNWEYNSEAFLGAYFNSILEFKTDAAYSQSTLDSIFMCAIGHPVKESDLDCWVTCFQEQLSMPKHSELREFVILNCLIKKETSDVVQRRYLKRFYEAQFEYNGNSLSLSDLYIPNGFKINNEGPVYYDLLNLIEQYCAGHLNVWLSHNNVKPLTDVNVLFILGHQCAGKSTLVSEIISNYYSKERTSYVPLFVISFFDKSIRDSGLELDAILDYLSVSLESLQNSLLIIDGLDESNYSDVDAIDAIDDLSRDLYELNAHLIITSRPGYFLPNGFRCSIEVYIQPFSLNQAKDWLALYCELYERDDAKIILSKIQSLSADVQRVILIPYVFQTCVSLGIDFSEITEFPKLYHILFDGENPISSTTPYNFRRRNRLREWRNYDSIITDISISYFQSTDNTIRTKDLQVDMDEELSQKIFNEYFLLKRGSEQYSFIHDSIPHYFIARLLFRSMLESRKDMFHFSSTLRKILGDSQCVPTEVCDFIEFFVRSENCEDIENPLHYLRLFLSDKLRCYFTMNSDLKGITDFYYRLFVSSLRVVTAFIKPNIHPFQKYDLFSVLSAEEINTLIMYSQLGDTSLDCFRSCSFSHKILDGLNLSASCLGGLNFSSSQMRRSSFKRTILSGAYLLNSDFSLSDFTCSYCCNADFSNSIMLGCSFRNAKLGGANFSNCVLVGADFRGAHLNKVRFDGANLGFSKMSLSVFSELHDIDPAFIRFNHIEIYSENGLVDGSELERIFKEKRPVAYAFRLKQ